MTPSQHHEPPPPQHEDMYNPSTNDEEEDDGGGSVPSASKVGFKKAPLILSPWRDPLPAHYVQDELNTLPLDRHAYIPGHEAVLLLLLMMMTRNARDHKHSCTCTYDDDGWIVKQKSSSNSRIHPQTFLFPIHNYVCSSCSRAPPFRLSFIQIAKLVRATGRVHKTNGI